MVYGESTGSGGFQVGFRAGRDFSGDPIATGRVPFAVPMPGIANAAAVEYRGMLDVPASGTYGFALDGTSSSQIFVDDELARGQRRRAPAPPRRSNARSRARPAHGLCPVRRHGPTRLVPTPPRTVARLGACERQRVPCTRRRLPHDAIGHHRAKPRFVAQRRAAGAGPRCSDGHRHRTRWDCCGRRREQARLHRTGRRRAAHRHRRRWAH